jgi:hypothetical protein
MRRGVGLYSNLGGGFSGNPGTAAGFATADDTNRTTAPGDRRDWKGGPALGGYRTVQPAFGGPAKQIARHRSCRRRGSTFSAVGTAAKQITHVGTRIAIYGNAYSEQRENLVAWRRDELGDRPVADGALIVILGGQTPK